MKENLRKHLWSLIALSVLIIFAVGSTDTDMGSNSVSGSSHTTGFKLAVIDGNYGVTEQTTIVQQFNIVLGKLAHKMSTTKEDIADAAVAVQDRLKEGYSIEVSLKSILGNACLLTDSYNDVTDLFVAVLNEYKY
ncbi:MAG: hypothetical protein P9M02_02260 [Candidatus Susulua stagnicola]|nr:hypothetical protein [Candidatus Susulua stagnicola]